MEIYITFYKNALNDKLQRKNIIIGTKVENLLKAADILCKDSPDYCFYAYQVGIEIYQLELFYKIFYNQNNPALIQGDTLFGFYGDKALPWKCNVLEINL